MKKLSFLLAFLSCFSASASNTLLENHVDYIKTVLTVRGLKVESIEILPNSLRNQLASAADSVGRSNQDIHHLQAKITMEGGVVLKCNRITLVTENNGSIYTGYPEIKGCQLF